MMMIRLRNPRLRQSGQLPHRQGGLDRRQEPFQMYVSIYVYEKTPKSLSTKPILPYSSSSLRGCTQLTPPPTAPSPKQTSHDPPPHSPSSPKPHSHSESPDRDRPKTRHHHHHHHDASKAPHQDDDEEEASSPPSSSHHDMPRIGHLYQG